MQAPAGGVAVHLERIPLEEYRTVWKEWKKLSDHLKIIKSCKTLPIKIGVTGWGAILTAIMGRLTFKQVGGTLYRGLAFTAVAALSIPAWLIVITLLNRYVIKRFPSIIRSRRDKHDFENAVLDWVWRTNITDRVSLGEFHNDHPEKFTQKLCWHIWARANGSTREQADKGTGHFGQ